MRELFEEYSGPIITSIVVISLIAIIAVVTNGGLISDKIGEMIDNAFGHEERPRDSTDLVPVITSDGAHYELVDNGNGTYILKITTLGENTTVEGDTIKINE